MKGGALERPWLDTKDLLVTLGSVPTFEGTSDIAIRAMPGFLMT